MSARTSIWSILPAALFATAALAQQPATVVAKDAWARATPPGASTGVIYLTLTSASGDRLTSVATPAAASAGVHRELTEGGIMRMRPVTGGLNLPAGQPVVLAPGGLHIMLEGLTAPLRQGGKVTVHLTFTKSPPLDVVATVGPIGASGPGMGMDMDMPMGH